MSLWREIKKKKKKKQKHLVACVLEIVRESVLLSPPGVNPGLVSVVLVGVVQQLVIGRNGPLSPPLACWAAYRRNFKYC